MAVIGQNESTNRRKLGFVLLALAGVAVVLAMFGQSQPYGSQIRILIPIGLFLALGLVITSVIMAARSRIQERKKKRKPVRPSITAVKSQPKAKR
jgi:hypothetical protein